VLSGLCATPASERSPVNRALSAGLILVAMLSGMTMGLVCGIKIGVAQTQHQAGK